MLVVVCLVCCVLWLCFMKGEQLLATMLVESQHRPRQNGQLLRNHIIEYVPKDPE